MKRTQTLVNRQGSLWTVEQRESERLTHIGGFLMTYDDMSCITLSTLLNEADKARGRTLLLERLVDTDIGADGVYLWYATNK